MWSEFMLVIVFSGIFQGCLSQQAYVDNHQLDCETNFTSTLGYVCNGSATSCPSYLTFRSQPPKYDTPTTIATLLRSNASAITRINNFSSDSATIPAGSLVIVPIANCSCSDSPRRQYYQHNVAYVLPSPNDTYFIAANNTYEGLTTCQAMIAQNPYNYRQLAAGMNVTIPLRCACPTANQTAAGIRYLLTYLITWGDTYESIAAAFGGVDVQQIYDANQLSHNDLIFPFTTFLVPLTSEPTNINTSATPSPPPSPPISPAVPVDDSGSSTKWVFVGVGIGLAILVIILCLSAAFVIIRSRRRRRLRENYIPKQPPPFAGYNAAAANQDKDKQTPPTSTWSVSSEGVRFAIESLTVYKYEDLEMATGFFSEENRIKGSVYKGFFKGDYAAVKMMKGDVSAEINILKQINHSNIIRLSGFCVHQGNTYLVYEFADNGSLADWLHFTYTTMAANKNHPTTEDGNSSNSFMTLLGWKQRVQIAYDIADALNYLHNFVNPPYIHKNLKSSNVLLDGQMRAKVANFGLARSLEENEDGANLQMTRHVVGTFGYMPPEYIEHGLITPKLDVFALGVLILELLSGKEAAPASGEKGTEDKGNNNKVEVEELQLSAKIKEVLGGENVRQKLVEFIDSRLGNDYPLELAYTMAELARKCVDDDLNCRPSMAEVFMSLSKILSSSLDWDPSYELDNSRSLGSGR